MARRAVPARHCGPQFRDLRPLPALDPADQCSRPPDAGRPARTQAAEPARRVSRERTGVALQGAHRGPVQHPRRRAGAAGVLLLAAVPEPRHRQLVRARGQPGPEGYARAVACRARRTRARVPAEHRGRGAQPVRDLGPRAGRDPGSRAAREQRDRVHDRGAADADPRDELGPPDGCDARTGHRRDDAAGKAWPALREPRHRCRRPVRDPRRCAAGQQRQLLRARAAGRVSGAAAPQ